jgi:ribosome modulation factor
MSKIKVTTGEEDEDNLLALGKLYSQGYKAFQNSVSVVNCPNSANCEAWLSGWQDAFNDFLGNFN